MILAWRMEPASHNGLDEIEALSKFDVYAGDGHYHKASVHERPVGGQRWAVAHFYALNLRTHAVTHLTGQDLQGGRKKEHDMHALKRLSAAQLRQGAPKGRKVLYVWDSAGIDFRQWYDWKHGSGLYMLSRLKDNMKYEVYGALPFERDDPLNAGVEADGLIATATSGYQLRLIRYRCPASGTLFEFLTNEMTLCPGVLAYLYKRRWDIEVFFKISKSYLQLAKEFQSRSYDALVAHTTIVFARYIMLELARRSAKDPRTLGTLFHAGCDELRQASFAEAVALLLHAFRSLVKRFAGEIAAPVAAALEAFMAQLPVIIRRPMLLPASIL